MLSVNQLLTDVKKFTIKCRPILKLLQNVGKIQYKPFPMLRDPRKTIYTGRAKLVSGQSD